MNSFKPVRKDVIILISFAVLLYIGVQNIGNIASYIGIFIGYLSPFLLGFAIAFILNSVMQKIETGLFSKPWRSCNSFRMKAARPLSLILTLVLVFGILVGVLFLLIPQLIQAITSLANQIPGFFTKLEGWVAEQSNNSPAFSKLFGSVKLDFESISQGLFAWIRSIRNQILSSTISFSMSIVSAVTGFIMSLILAIYLLSQKEKLGRQVRSLLYSVLKEKHADRLLSVSRLCNSIFSGFVTGQLLESLINGTYYLIILSILGFPYAALIGVIIMVCSVIPMIGPFIACVIASLLILTSSGSMALWFIIIFLISSQIEGNLIYPRVVGRSVGLSPIWVFAAILIGSSIGGFIGMLVGIPVMSIIYNLVSAWIHSKLEKRRVPLFKTDDPPISE